MFQIKLIAVGVALLTIMGLFSWGLWQRNTVIKQQGIINVQGIDIKAKEITIVKLEKNKVAIKELQAKYQQATDTIAALLGAEGYEQNPTKCLQKSDEVILDGLVDLYNSRLRKSDNTSANGKVLPAANSTDNIKTDWKIKDVIDMAAKETNLIIQYFDYQVCYESNN